MKKVDDYDISHIPGVLNNKDVFVFVNHKTALFCWAKLKEKFGAFDVISFDSHNDYSGGFLYSANEPNPQLIALGSKFVIHKPHFSTSDEFMKWNLLNDAENYRIVTKEHKFLKRISDNHIDVAFMKDIIKDFHTYYHTLDGSTSNSECDDINGQIHKFYLNPVTDFVEPTKPFVLDIDLDFFVYKSDWDRKLMEESKMKKYLILFSNLFKSRYCIGVTIALEPNFCEKHDAIRNNNSPIIWRAISKGFYPEFEKITKQLLGRSVTLQSPKVTPHQKLGTTKNKQQ